MACVTTWHLIDHVAHDQGRNTDDVWKDVKPRCAEAWTVVYEYCRGTKHPSSIKRSRTGLGTEVHYEVLEWGKSWNNKRWGKPGLAVTLEDKVFFIDNCVQVVLISYISMYAPQFEGVDLNILGEQFMRSVLIACVLPKPQLDVP